MKIKFKINSKNSVKRALESLVDQREAKKKRTMVAEKETEQAVKAWQYYIERIKQAQKSILNAETFAKLNVYELQAKLNAVQSLNQNLEEKFVILSSLAGQAEIAQTHEESVALCEVLQATILARIAEIRKVERSQSTGIKRAIAATNTSQGVADDINEQVPIKQVTWGFFGGEICEWQGFSKRFKEQVHEVVGITDQEKLVLLLKSCFDHARDIVKNAGSSYETVWNNLNDLFGDAYITIHHAVHQVMTIPPMFEASYDNVKRLAKHGKKCQEMLTGINAADKFDPFLVILIASKLDPFTAKAWDRYRNILAESWASGTEEDGTKRQKMMYVPPWIEFEKFLNDECNVYVRSQIRQNLAIGIAPNEQQNRVSVGTNQGTSGMQACPPVRTTAQEKRNAPVDMQCKLCDGIHMLYKCDTFKAMDQAQRWDVVEKIGLCARCLRKYHGNAPCINKTNNEKCPRCWKHSMKEVYHNSSLCVVGAGEINDQPRSTQAPSNDEDWE